MRRGGSRSRQASRRWFVGTNSLSILRAGCVPRPPSARRCRRGTTPALGARSGWPKGTKPPQHPASTPGANRPKPLAHRPIGRTTNRRCAAFAHAPWFPLPWRRRCRKGRLSPWRGPTPARPPWRGCWRFLTSNRNPRPKERLGIPPASLPRSSVRPTWRERRRHEGCQAQGFAKPRRPEAARTARGC